MLKLESSVLQKHCIFATFDGILSLQQSWLSQENLEKVQFFVRSTGFPELHKNKLSKVLKSNCFTDGAEGMDQHESSDRRRRLGRHRRERSGHWIYKA